jgi:hypothetical protein
VKVSPLSVSVLALGSLACYPILTIGVGAQSMWLILPDLMLVPATPFVAILGTVLGCYALIRGTGGGNNLGVASIGLALSAFAVGYVIFAINQASSL